MSSDQTSVAEMIKLLGTSIAQAQFQMDQTSVKIARMLGHEDSMVEIAGQRRTLLELGFVPTFYQLTEATVEAKVSFSTTRSQSASVSATIGANVGFFAASVNASYSQKYSYTATGSSSISARFVSVPPPTVFADALREAREKNRSIDN